MMTGATTTHYSPEYLAEYNGDILLGTAITFMVVETVVMMLMVLSRYFAHGERTNYSMEVFLTMTYLVCMGKVTTAICKSPSIESCF